jgi:two-component system chemotaxis response regulator CheB
VCGTARNGQEVVERTKLLQPDVITLDVEMPLLNGVEALKRIMSECPRPVIMFSSATQEGTEVTLAALSAGAFDYLPKVSFQPGTNVLKLQQDLIEKIEAASHSALARKRAPFHPLLPSSALRTHLHEKTRPVPRIVVLSTSTGGPQALQGLLPELPADLPVAMIVVQHMPRVSLRPCQAPGWPIQGKSVRGPARRGCTAGTVYIAPAGQHTTLSKSSRQVSICLSDSPSGTIHKPSVDVTMLSVVEVFGDYTFGIILTGMGSDGLQGMTAIHHAGGTTIGQDEASSVAYGMPRCCAEHGILQQVVPLSRVSSHILHALRYHFHA